MLYWFRSRSFEIQKAIESRSYISMVCTSIEHQSELINSGELNRPIYLVHLHYRIAGCI